MRAYVPSRLYRRGTDEHRESASPRTPTGPWEHTLTLHVFPCVPEAFFEGTHDGNTRSQGAG